MKVLMVCRKYSGVRHDVWAPSGTPAVVKLIEELEARGHPTTVLLLAKTAGRQGERRGDSVTDYGIFRHVTFVHIGWRGAHGLPAVLSDLLNDTRQLFKILPYVFRGFDIRYFDRTHLGYAALASLYFRNVVWRCLGVLSFTIARDAGKQLGTLYLSLARVLVRFPIRLMVCTNDGSPWFRLFPQAVRKRLLLLTNGVDAPAAAPGNAADAPRLPQIGFVGRATLTKGLDIFLDTCAELCKRGCAFRAVVVGDGHYLAAARQQADMLGLGGTVEFAGAVPQAAVGAIFRDIDIYLTPARNGVFSNTTLEALAAGCCVVALEGDPQTGNDATTQKFLPGDLVHWASRSDPALRCADAVGALLNDPAGLKTLKARGRAFAQDALSSWPARIAKEVDVLESLANNGAVPHGALPGDDLARIAFGIEAA